jgi:glyoxylase-like metal-dependent hydrolase (beta-lactamase superfamily II)
MKRWLAGLLALLAAAAQAQEHFALQALAPGVYAAIDREGRAGANAGVVIGRDAIAVIDSLYQEAASRELLAAIRKLSALPIRYLVNTHHHIDHVAGNRLFAEAGATVIAQQQVAGWLYSENLRLLGGERITPAQRTQVEGLLAPQLGFETALRIELGGRQLLLRHRLGHTGGDTVVAVSDAPVLFMGDLLWRAAIPNLVDAQTQHWQQTLGSYAAMDDATRFVPGHGGVATPADVRDFADYLQQLRSTVREAGSDSERALTQLRLQFGAKAYFRGLAAANVRDMQAELTGTKRVPPPSD